MAEPHRRARSAQAISATRGVSLFLQPAEHILARPGERMDLYRTCRLAKMVRPGLAVPPSALEGVPVRAIHGATIPPGCGGAGYLASGVGRTSKRQRSLFSRLISMTRYLGEISISSYHPEGEQAARPAYCLYHDTISAALIARKSHPARKPHRLCGTALLAEYGQPARLGFASNGGRPYSRPLAWHYPAAPAHLSSFS